jgi:hypothetical protein
LYTESRNIFFKKIFSGADPGFQVWGFGLWCLTPLSIIFQLYHGYQFLVVEEAGVPGEKTTDHGQATRKLYHLRLHVECTLFVIYKAGHELTPYW